MFIVCSFFSLFVFSGKDLKSPKGIKNILKKVPEEFWKLLALYMSLNSLSSLPWAIPYGEVEVKIMINQSNNILDWYNDMKRYVPKLYTKK